MHWVYNFSIKVYHFIIILAAPFKAKGKAFLDGRKGWREFLRHKLAERPSRLIWVHAASQGEYQQGLPIIQQLKEAGEKKADEKVFVLLTFFSPAGYDTYEPTEHVDAVAYLPLDYKRNVRDFLDLVQPQVAVFIKYEFWYNFMMELAHRSVPLLLVSAVFRSDQMFFHPMGRFYLKALRKTAHFFVQDEQSGKLLASHHINQFTVTGDSRLDQMKMVKRTLWHDQRISNFVGDGLVVVCGSVWLSDWKFLKSIIHSFPQVKFLVAPHEVSEESLALLEGKDIVRWSRYKPGGRVLLIDKVGALKYLYRFANIAYVGGAWRGAVHNTIEPAIYGVPVIIGDHINNEKFNEVMDLKEAGGLKTYSSRVELFDIFEELITDYEKREAMGRLNLNYVNSRTGATELVMSKLKTYL